MLNVERVKEILEGIKPAFLEISKELGRGYNFKGSAICKPEKKECTIIIENDIKI